MGVGTLGTNSLWEKLFLNVEIPPNLIGVKNNSVMLEGF